MPFTNHEVAVIVANELNRHDRGLWFYKVERHIDDKRWIIARKAARRRKAPDDASMARYVLQFRSLGFVRTKTLKAFPETAYREIIRSLG